MDLERGYTFSPLLGVPIPKKDPSKLRLICVPTVADRLVQRALLNAIEPHSVRLGIANAVSYGFVRGTDGGKSGVQGARQAAVKYRKTLPWVFKADISKFFDDIRRPELSNDICRSLGLKSLSSLLIGAISCEVRADSDRVKLAMAQNGIRPGQGLRQGMPLSPILSNFVLRQFDKTVGSKHRMVRYADDLMVLTSTEAERDVAARLVEEELSKLGLRISQEKTFRHTPDEPVEFLGMELGLNKAKSGYQLTISEAQMAEIRSVFRRYHSSDQADKDGLNAATLFRRLEQMRLGYISAYWGADNLNAFEARLQMWMHECSKRVYGSIFGKEAISRLTGPQRRFLMLP